MVGYDLVCSKCDCVCDCRAYKIMEKIPEKAYFDINKQSFYCDHAPLRFYIADIIEFLEKYNASNEGDLK
jgi:hypothetical protein